MQITHVAKIIVNIKPGDSTLVINVTIKLSWAASTENTIAGYDARNPGQILLRNPTESSRLELVSDDKATKQKPGWSARSNLSVKIPLSKPACFICLSSALATVSCIWSSSNLHTNTFSGGGKFVSARISAPIAAYRSRDQQPHRNNL
jgi:hypothetical protein